MIRTALLVAFSATLAACAQLETADRRASRDAELVRGIVQANLAQIDAGKLAASRARARAVRQYGQRMVREHTLLQAEASELKTVQGVPLPTRADARHEAALRNLRALSGAAFDAAYIEQMVQDHGALLKLLERATSRAADPALASHAQRAMPRVRRHLEAAKRLSV